MTTMRNDLQPARGDIAPWTTDLPARALGAAPPESIDTPRAGPGAGTGAGLRSRCAGLLALLTLLTAPASLAGDREYPEDPVVPGEALVRIAATSTLEAFLESFQASFPGTAVVDEIPSRQTYKLALPPGANEDAVEAALLQQVGAGTLVWGELNYEGQAAEGKTDSIWVTQIDVGFTEYVEQYAGSLLGLDGAHAISQGQGVLVAVLDTGIDPGHPQLSARLAPGGASFVTGAGVDDAGNGLDDDGDGAVDEMVGHGTFVAGLIVRVAPQARLLPVVVLDSDGIGDTFSIAEGLYHAIDAGARIVNCSFGSTYKGEAVEDALAEANSKGVLVVGAAGNFGTDDPEEFPALIDEGFGVGATTPQDLKAPFSNYHDKMDLCAPGASTPDGGRPGLYDPSASVISTLPGDGYGVWSGTSFATAFVSGAAALVRAQYPGAANDSLMVAILRASLQNSAVPLDPINPQYAGMLGAGRLNVAGAVSFAPPAPPLGDLDANGAIDGADLGMLLGAWGACGAPCPADLTFDGTVDGADLGALLAVWTAGDP